MENNDSINSLVFRLRVEQRMKTGGITDGWAADLADAIPLKVGLYPLLMGVLNVLLCTNGLLLLFQRQLREEVC